ncbi:calpain-5-like [Montipora foliosa]|uniref:calpain-5-like n=1 Tax=Montipora foliosa TaxID=591990 RepID=UPI0035F11C87
MVKLHYLRNQRYDKLKSQCLKQRKLFKDSEFPAEDLSMFFSRSPTEPVEWKRPKDICSPDLPNLFVDGSSTHDITQGKLGNCWFVAACSTLALETSLLEKVIPDKSDQEWDPEDDSKYQGIFKFRFWRQGEWTEVVIDDLLPTIDGQLLYVHSSQRNEFWGSLLEKAYAKLNGSYEALEAGNIADALVDFTGGVCESTNLQETGFNSDEEGRLAYFNTMQKAMNERSLIGASISVKNKADMERRTETGLVMGHAYGVTAIKKITTGEGLFNLFNREHLYLIRLRNPWGHKEWNGPWSDGSAEWKNLDEGQRAKLGIKADDDGEFWMLFEDFCRYFTKTTMCYVMNTSRFSLSKRWHLFKHNNEWKPGLSAGGCVTNQDTFMQNPQYAFTIKDSGKGEVLIALMQEDTRIERNEGGKNLSIGYYIMKVEENRKYRLHSMFEKAGDTIFINTREVANRYQMKQGRYVIVPSTFDANEGGKFMLRIFTEKSSNAMVLEKDHPTGSKICCCIPRYRTPVCVLSVLVKSAADLKKKSALLSLDPYALITCEGRTIRTPTFSGTADPEWNSGALFFVRRPKKTHLVVQIWDSNVFCDSFLGQAKMTIDANNRTVVLSHQLMGRRQKENERMPGAVTLEIACYSDLLAV